MAYKNLLVLCFIVSVSVVWYLEDGHDNEKALHTPNGHLEKPPSYQVRNYARKPHDFSSRTPSFVKAKPKKQFLFSMLLEDESIAESVFMEGIEPISGCQIPDITDLEVGDVLIMPIESIRYAYKVTSVLKQESHLRIVAFTRENEIKYPLILTQRGADTLITLSTPFAMYEVVAHDNKGLLYRSADIDSIRLDPRLQDTVASAP